MTARYAEKTEVSSDKSRNEIEATLRRYGATAFAYGWSAEAAQIMFEIADRRVIMRLPLPDRKAEQFRRAYVNKTAWNWATPEQAEKKWEQACRQSWRALALIIKAKLEAVAAGITTVEQEFLAHIALPSGKTVGEWVGPQLDEVYRSGQMPALMAGGS